MSLEKSKENGPSSYSPPAGFKASNTVTSTD